MQSGQTHQPNKVVPSSQHWRWKKEVDPVALAGFFVSAFIAVVVFRLNKNLANSRVRRDYLAGLIDEVRSALKAVHTEYVNIYRARVVMTSAVDIRMRTLTDALKHSIYILSDALERSNLVMSWQEIRTIQRNYHNVATRNTIGHNKHFDLTHSDFFEEARVYTAYMKTLSGITFNVHVAAIDGRVHRTKTVFLRWYEISANVTVRRFMKKSKTQMASSDSLVQSKRA